MKKPVERVVVWTPRVLGMLYAVFLGMFALDVFGEGYGVGKTALALLIHLLPTAVVVAVLVISWRREWLAGVVFFVAGLLYAFSTQGHLSWILGISGPLWLIGVLFIVSWFHRRGLPGGS